LTPWVVNLNQPEAADAELVGGKAAGLHRLAAAGLPVPEGCVVTTAAFRAHFPAATPDSPPPTTGLNPELARALQRAVVDVFGNEDVYLAVRSSAVAEDGASASFAGAHATYYYIRPGALSEAIQDCWASLWARHALAYRRQRHIPAGQFAMAVIVQRMVQADRSGVCFTADPTGAHPENAWVEAIWGLGAALVDGRVTPDRLLLDRSGQILRQHIGRKRHQVEASPGYPQGDRLEAVPSYRQTQPVLSQAEAEEVLAKSLAAERLFGTPQDVEWAFAGNQFFLLQSRPITTTGEPSGRSLPTPTRNGAARARDRGNWVLFKPLAENFTDPLTPMTVDLMRRMLPGGCRFFDGRLYLDLDRASLLCPFRWTTAQITDALLLRGDLPRLTWNWRKVPVATAALAGAYLLDGISWHRTSALPPEALSSFERVCNKVRNAPRYDARKGLQRLVLGRHPFEPIGRLAYYVNVSSGRYFLLLAILRQLVERYAPGFDRNQLSWLCSGDGATWSRRMVEGVRALACEARRDPELVRQLCEGDGSRVKQALSRLPDDHPFALAIAEFLQHFGHRCAREMELATPRWREDPVAVLRMVRNYLKAPEQVPEDPQAQRAAAVEALREALPRRWQQRLALYLADRIRYYVCLRENTRHYHAMAMDATRAKLLDLEQQLLAEGRLRVPGDVFYLTWEEAAGLARGDQGWDDVSVLIRRRRRSRSQAARVGAPEILTMDKRGGVRAGAAVRARMAPVHTASDSTGRSIVTILSGHCASPGVAEGRVRLILDPATADFQPGDVLVAPFTDPAWTPLFPLASAVVVELGSFLSHAGTVAREYRIPCLVDVEHCTRLLRDGQLVRVLASEGRLEVLES
jgi:rifampicin phosphotransferase